MEAALERHDLEACGDDSRLGVASSAPAQRARPEEAIQGALQQAERGARRTCFQTEARRLPVGRAATPAARRPDPGRCRAGPRRRRRRTRRPAPAAPRRCRRRSRSAPLRLARAPPPRRVPLDPARPRATALRPAGSARTTGRLRSRPRALGRAVRRAGCVAARGRRDRAVAARAARGSARNATAPGHRAAVPYSSA